MKLRLRSGKTLTLIAYYFLQWEACNETITVSITCERMYFVMMQSVSHSVIHLLPLSPPWEARFPHEFCSSR